MNAHCAVQPPSTGIAAPVRLWAAGSHSHSTSLPEEIARVVLWLCEPAAHNLTGAAIPVDGGWTAQ